MLRVNTYAFGDILPSADLDTIQDNALGYAQFLGGIVGPRYIYCDDGSVVHVGPVSAVVLSGGNNVLLGSDSPFSLGPTTVASTQYYVYAINNAGALDMVVLTDPPMLNGVFRNNGGSPDRTHRYLGCFRTNASNVILPFYARNGHYVYRRSPTFVSASDFLALNGGTATALTAVSLASWVPPHAGLANLELFLSLDALGAYADYGLVVTHGDTGSFSHTLVGNNANDFIRSTIEIVTSIDQKIDYKVINTAHPPVLSIYVNGFTE